MQRHEQPGRIDHFCVGVEGFDVDRHKAAAKVAGMNIQDTGADTFLVRDPDGIGVQVSAVGSTF